MKNLYFRVALVATAVVLVFNFYTYISEATPSTARQAGLRIKDTNYPIPEGAFFVATTGSDNNDGSAGAPWRTIGKAIATAPSGSTIVIREGVYRESAGVIDSKQLTLQPYPHEQVWMKGSVIVSDWVADGSVWRKDGWTYEFSHGPDAVDKTALDQNYPLAGWPDMVFIDGVPLTQVASLSAVSAGTFYVDDANDKLYIGSNPTGRLVEAAALVHPLKLNYTRGSIIRGLGFMHYAPHFNGDQKCMVRGDTAGVTFENNTFAWSASGGLCIYGPDVVVSGNSFLYNGHLGLFGNVVDRLLLENNYFAYNNQERFRLFWESGGAKIIRSHSMIWRDNVAEYNMGAGLWCDIDCRDNIIVRNITNYNHKHGIQYELSFDAIIASNIAVKNHLNGIQVGWGSQNISVYNNTTARNGESNIAVVGDWDKDRQAFTTNIVIKNNIMSNNGGTSDPLLAVRDYSGSTQNIGPNMIQELDYNAYYRTSSNVPKSVIDWQQVDAQQVPMNLKFKNLADFRMKTGHEQHGLGIDNQATNPFFVDETQDNYRLKPDSPARGAGQALPRAVADAIGVPAGSNVDMGALLWPIFVEPAPAPTATPTPTLDPQTPTPTTQSQLPTPTLAPGQTPQPTPTPEPSPEPGLLQFDRFLPLLGE